MKVTILCEDIFIKEVREKAKSLFGNKMTLKSPVSITGKEPATHWVCSLEVTEEGYQKLINLREKTIMGKCSQSILLDEMQLKLIK